VSKRQKFTIHRIHRRAIQFAPYNPRTIDRHAQGKLRDNLKRVGLVAPLVWNETTGNLVSGHQRLRAMDEIEGSDDYYLDVARVALDPVTEREQNVFMNNESAQGTWDLDLLETLVKSPELKFDPAMAGFDPIDLEELVPTAKSTFSIGSASPEAKRVMAEVEAFSEEVNAAKGEPKEKEEDETEDEGPANAEDSNGEAGEDPATHAEGEDAGGNDAEGPNPETRLQDKKNAYRAQRKDEMDTGFFLVVVFPTRPAREAFCQSVGLPHNSEYVDGGRFETIVADAQSGKVAAAKLGAP